MRPMTEVTTLLRSALDDEPPLGFTSTDILNKARAARRRRRGGLFLVGMSGIAAAVVALMLVFTTAPQVHSTRSSPPLSLAALEHTAASRPAQQPALVGSGIKVGVVSTSNLAALVEQDTGVTLTNVNVAALPPDGVINLSAGIEASGEPYLNAQVAPAHTMETVVPSCADLSDLNSGDGDGFYGPCSITKLSDGSSLVVRSGETKIGGYTMAQALLVHPDGSGIFAENTNQTAATPRLAWSNSTGSSLHRSASTRPGAQNPMAVRPLPVLDSKAMATLVLDLSAQTTS